MADNRVIFDTVKPWLDSKGWTPERIAALDAAIARATGQTPAPAAPPPAPPAAASGRHVSPAGVKLIHGFEKCVLTAYPDPGSRDGTPWTVGWGATGPGIQRGTVWTQEQADARFAADLARMEAAVDKLLGTSPTTQSQFDALVSLAYNIGPGDKGLGKASLLRKHKAGDFTGAADGFKAWRFNDGKEMRGLLNRRLAEAAHYRGQA